MKSAGSLLFAVLAAVGAYFGAHPLAVAYAATLALSCAHDLLVRYPRLQGLAKLAAALGLDGPKIVQAVIQAVIGAGSPPSPPAPPAGPSVLSAAVLCLSLGLIRCSGSTASSATATAAQQADVAAYAAEEQACVQNADGSLSAANACIAAVQSRWCGDGGMLTGFCAGQTPTAPKPPSAPAPSSLPSLDGGAQ